MQNANATEASSVIVVLDFLGHWKNLCQKIFAVPTMKQDAEILLLILEVFAHLWSIIIPDKWGTCNKIDKNEQGYNHQTINHSEYFIDPIIGACANRIGSE